MDRSRRVRGRREREDKTPPPPLIVVPPPAAHPPPPPPPVAPPPPAQGDQASLFTMMRDMMQMMQQQQQQTQQMLLQQQQQFFQQFAMQANAGQAGLAQAGPARAREVRLPEFVKLAPSFNGKSTDPAQAETWIAEVEKAFRACQVETDEAKMGLAEYQLKEEANNWWIFKKANLREPVTWEQFKEIFFEQYFPSSTRDKMFSQLLTLR